MRSCEDGDKVIAGEMSGAWKLVQRRCYDLLSHRYSLLVILVALTCVFVGIVHFGEVWIAWSKEKYKAVFYSFNDNIIGISFQRELCQHVLIDVAYTWVDGTDSLFIENLNRYVTVTSANIRVPNSGCGQNRKMLFLRMADHADFIRRAVKTFTG